MNHTGIIVTFAAHDGFAKRNAIIELGFTLPLGVIEGISANLHITAISTSIVALHRRRSVTATGRSTSALHLRNWSRSDGMDPIKP